jgi:hypothetical protein
VKLVRSGTGRSIEPNGRAQELAERGKDWVRREFDWSRLVEQTEAVYRRVSDAQAPG